MSIQGATKVFLVFTTQPGAATAGSTIPGPPTVTVQDGLGNTVTSSTASITVAIGTNPPGNGTLSGTLTKNAVSGVASFSDLSINQAGNGYTLTASSAGLTGATSSAFNINAAAAVATKLVVTSVNGGSNPTAGAGFAVVVQAQDNSSSPANVTANTAVTLSLKTGTGILGGTLSGTILAGTNQVTISGVTYSKAESGVVITATRTSGDTLTAGDSVAFTVNPGATSILVFTTQPGAATAGSTIPGPPTVTVQDGLGNTLTSSTASITVAIGNNPSSGTLSGTLTKNAVSGVASFSDLSINQAGNGYTLTASSAGLTGATSSAFNINAAAAGPVLAYGFEEGSGTTTQDWSGGENDGTLLPTVNGPVWVAGQNVGFGLSFDGTNDYVETGNTANLPNWTISGWVISPAAPANAAPSGPIHRNSNYAISWNHNNVAFRGTATLRIGPTWHAASFGPLIANTWYYLAATYDGETLNAYKDGVLITSNTAPSGPASSDTNSLKLGRHAASAAFFRGTVDEVRVYNRALSEAEIQSDMITPVAPASGPGITNLNPSSGPVGTAVVITGTNFGAAPQTSTVTFNGTAASPTNWSNTSITVPVPSGATTGNVVVSVGGVASNGVAFTVTAAVATKLVVTSVNGGSNPTAGAGFAVVVQAQDNSSSPANVTANTAVTLSLKTGTGILGGTLSGTILAGTNQVTISGVTYSKAESGVVITATRTSGDTLTAGDSAAFTVNPGATSILVFTTQPGAATAGSTIAGPPTVTVQDGLGNTVTSSTASITVAIGTNPPGNGTLSGTLTKNAVSGVASFSDLSINQAGNGYTLTASSAGLTGATSSAFNINAVAAVATKLVVTSVNGGSNPTAGAGFAVVVQAQDNSSSPANVTANTAVTLSLKTGTGTLGGTLSGTILAGTNQVTISGVTYSKAESGVVITATRTSGDTLTAGDSAAFTVNPGATSILVFTTQPGAATAGSTIPGPPTVTVQDGLGNTVTSSTASITVAIGTNPPGNGTLSGTLTKNAVSGVASFSDLSINQAGNGYTLTASSAGLTGATSSAFNINAAAAVATKLVVTSVNGGSNPTAGAGFAVVVQAQDNSSSPANVTANTAVTLSLKTGTGILGGTLSGTILAGTNQVTISGVTYSKAESGVVITATRTSGDTLTAGDSVAFTVNPGATSILVFTTQPGAATAGSTIPGPPTVTVQDGLGNTLTSSTASITVAIGNNPSSGTLSGTLTKNAVSGVASFSDLSINQAGNGYTLTASSAGLTGATSSAFNINAAAAGPVLAYGFEEGSGTTTQDWSGGENDGTLLPTVNGPVWVAGQNVGFGLSFDGTNDYVETGNTANLPNWTISGWVISPAAPANAAPSGPIHRNSNYAISWNHNNVAFRGTATLRIGPTWHAASFGPLIANTWYYLAATYDGETLNAYKDGVLITSNTAPSGPASSDTNSLKLGRHAASAAFFRGTVDEVRVYNRALSEAEINIDMQTPVAPPP